ncbi:MAG: NUDIX hydrolase [Flavobacteriales bacterium]
MGIQQNIFMAVDAVVFGYHDKKLHLLLIQSAFGTKHDQWALPGGFVKDTETLDQAVKRELVEETGVNANYLEQLYTFSDVDRDPRQRVVSVAYLGLINPKNYLLKADTDVKDTRWFPIDEIPKLAFDHQNILKKGKERLISKINYQPIGFELLKKEFPFSDLENLYQTILDKKIDRRNFRKKILSFGILEETDKIFQGKGGRPAKLFRFNEKKYQELEKKGFHFEIKLA